jgi:UDP-N-acetylmuramoylalanine--D-glutamate ligase
MEKMEFTRKRIALLGFGLEGKDVFGFLSEEDSEITIFDSKKKEELDLNGISDQVKFSLGPDYLKNGLVDFDIIVRSPGIYRHLPEITEAEKMGVKVTSATQIFFEYCPAKIIGVTGTKGKGTTSTLIYEILKSAGKKVHLVGNIGKPFLELLDTLESDDVVIMELSSFQLIDLTKSPHIAVVLNITSDHLDWHKDNLEYLTAKKNIVAHQSENDFAVINYDYETSRSFEKLGWAKKYFFSKLQKVKGSYVSDGEIFLSVEKEVQPIGPVSKLLLRGSHNWENITASIATSFLAGANVDSISKAVFDFKGLEHRLELVGEVDGIKFYNDSFATGPQPTLAAVKSFFEPITLILGGSDKGLNYSEMAKTLVEQKNLKSVILIGEIGSDIGNTLIGAGYSGNMVNLGTSSMGEVLKRAKEDTPRGGVVLLSPAAASFDMFKNYKERGNAFKNAVKEFGNV